MNEAYLTSKKEETQSSFLYGDNFLRYLLEHNLYRNDETLGKSTEIKAEGKKMSSIISRYFDSDKSKNSSASSHLSKNADNLVQRTRKDNIIRCIHNIITNIVRDYRCGRNPSFSIPQHSIVFIKRRWQVNEKKKKYKTVSFKNKRSRTKFNCMLYMLHNIKSGLEHNKSSTKREFLYKLMPNKKQQFTDKILQETTCLLNVGIWHLNIKVQKKLVYDFSTQDHDGSASFILVVEKETIYNKLIESSLHQYISKPFIIITGKGFPDSSTQLSLKEMWNNLKIPVLILVDADPYGIEIMMNYCFGSMTSAYLSAYLAVPEAIWIGVLPSTITKYSKDTKPLSEQDTKKIESMLERDCMKTEEQIRNELQILKENGVKCELESLSMVSLFSLIKESI